MIIKYAKHFLTAEGREYFSLWVKDLKKAAAEQEGFNRVTAMKKEGDEKTIHLFLEFSNGDAFQTWITSTVHEVLLKKLEPYQEKPWEAQSFIEI